MSSCKSSLKFGKRARLREDKAEPLDRGASSKMRRGILIGFGFEETSNYQQRAF